MYLILKGLLLIILFFYVCYSPCIIQVIKMPWQKHLETGFFLISRLFSLQTYKAAATDQQPLHRLIYIFVQVRPENYWQPAQLWNKEQETSPSGVLNSCSFQPKLQPSQQDQLWRKAIPFCFCMSLSAGITLKTPLLQLTLCPVWWAIVQTPGKSS